jgi:hypothetical protein
MKSERGAPWPPLRPEPIKPEPPWVMPIPEFGRRYYGLGKSAAYAAAKRRDIPVKRIGGKLMGLPRVAEAMLSGKLPDPEAPPSTL